MSSSRAHTKAAAKIGGHGVSDDLLWAEEGLVIEPDKVGCHERLCRTHGHLLCHDPLVVEELLARVSKQAQKVGRRRAPVGAKRIGRRRGDCCCCHVQATAGFRGCHQHGSRHIYGTVVNDGMDAATTTTILSRHGRYMVERDHHQLGTDNRRRVKKATTQNRSLTTR